MSNFRFGCDPIDLACRNSGNKLMSNLHRDSLSSESSDSVSPLAAFVGASDAPATPVAPVTPAPVTPAPVTPVTPAPVTPAPVAPVTPLATPETQRRPQPTVREKEAVSKITDTFRALNASQNLAKMKRTVYSFLMTEIARLSDIAYAAKKFIDDTLQKNNEVNEWFEAYRFGESVNKWKKPFENEDEHSDRLLSALMERDESAKKIAQAEATLEKAQQKLKQYHTFNFELQNMENYLDLMPCQFLNNLKELLYGITQDIIKVDERKVDSQVSARKREEDKETLSVKLREYRELISTFMQEYPFEQLVQCDLEKDDLEYLIRLYEDNRDAAFKESNKKFYDKLLAKLASLRGGKRNQTLKSKRSKTKSKRSKTKSKKLQHRKNKSKRGMRMHAK